MFYNNFLLTNKKVTGQLRRDIPITVLTLNGMFGQDFYEPVNLKFTFWESFCAW